MLVKKLHNNDLCCPAIGQGIGQYKWTNDQIPVIRTGIEHGSTLIDTASNYDDGNAERIVGKAIEGVRDKVILCSKFSVECESYKDISDSLDKSLQRLHTDYVDVYQLHWPNYHYNINNIVEDMYKLKDQGKIKYIGLGNIYNNIIYDDVSTLQLEYNMFDRMVEQYILQMCYEKSIFLLAYSPLDQGYLVNGSEQVENMKKIASKYQKSISQIILRWLIHHPCVVAIPKSSTIQHVIENAQSMYFDLEQSDIDYIDYNIITPVVNISVTDIIVNNEGQGNRFAYHTVEEAIYNKQGFIPSPVCLSEIVKLNKNIKPVRVRKAKNGGYGKYELMEGRIRYWAYVIAFGTDTLIPAYVRNI